MTPVDTAFISALKAYHQSEKNSKSNQKGLLVYQENSWQVIRTMPQNPSNILLKTLEKVVTLNPKSINEEHLLYWIQNFNSEMALNSLKKKEIRPADSQAKKIQFSSMNTYAWLSNFFTTLIYDPLHKVFYPSVENGYVAFKARKASANETEILEFAHLIGSKKVKQLGADLWYRSSEEDTEDALEEMERLVTLKFKQNPFIAQWLKKTPASFEEFTNDGFWGSAMGTRIDENSNHLGKIIEKVRKML